MIWPRRFFPKLRPSGDLRSACQRGHAAPATISKSKKRSKLISVTHWLCGSPKAWISRLENNFGCLGELVNSIGSHFYLTPLLMRPLLTGVEMAGFTHRPGFKIKFFQIFYFPQNFTLYLLFYPVFSLQNPAVPGLQYPDFTPISAVVPAFTGYFSLKIFLDHHCSSPPCCKAPIRAYFNL